jgi:aspartyl-tRNA(Asn)/glutamyl-tRNA(Gln) amidotransferase subunit B
MIEYEPIIGLEVHAQIHTCSKMFCACAVPDDTGDLPPNTYVCPVCLAMPGTLPVINRRAVELTITTALALGCEIPTVSRFARKSYFYPDLPKGYQISQYALPLAVNGALQIEVESRVRSIGIRDVHLEEDTGKLYHREGYSLVDFNRAGVPLIEVVTQPDMRSVEEVRAFAETLRLILIYLGINSGDMEKGVMRFEASVSVRPAGSAVLNPRHEIKNLNSFRALSRAVEYEIIHQTAELERGGAVTQQTMGWGEGEGRTYVQRSKEQAHDYRYFPEPDLPPLEVGPEWVATLRDRLPELPEARRARFVSQYGLSPYDAALLVSDDWAIADYFERVCREGVVDPKSVANWITGPLFRLMNETGQAIGALLVTPPALASLIGMVEEGVVNRNTGQEVLQEMVETGRPAREIVEARGLAQISDLDALRDVVERVLDDHPSQVAEYVGGKASVQNWLMGQVMRVTRGRADPQSVQALLSEALENRLD